MVSLSLSFFLFIYLFLLKDCWFIILCYFQVYTAMLQLNIITIVVSDFLQPHGLQHTRLPCPSLSPGVCSHSCPLSRWCYPAISSSVIPFSSWPQSYSASESSPMSQLFASSSQSIRASASASVLPVNIQGRFPLWLTGLISLLSKGLTGT